MPKKNEITKLINSLKGSKKLPKPLDHEIEGGYDLLVEAEENSNI